MNETIPHKTYSKSSGFYFDKKSEFFNDNDWLLADTEGTNKLYTKQPPRINCKICNATLPDSCDFISHNVPYVFCDNCGHLNGMHDDTQYFAENLYVQSDGEGHAILYRSRFCAAN